MSGSDVWSTGEGNPSRVRWVIVALLFWVSMSNFLDRSVFGNLAPEMPEYLNLGALVSSAKVEGYWKMHPAEVAARAHASVGPRSSNAEAEQSSRAYIRAELARASWSETYWNLNTLFTAAYAISMLLMGRLIDRWGLRSGFAFATCIWAVAELMHTFAPEIGSIFGSAVAGFYVCRILLGVGEGGVSPAVVKAIAQWFPKEERALATGVASGASSVGAVVVPWLLPVLLLSFASVRVGGTMVGWRGLFLLTGSVDVLLIAVWLGFYRSPREHPAVNAAELAYIHRDIERGTDLAIGWRKLVLHRQTWAFVAAKSLTDGFWWFYLFGSPDFFSRKFSLNPAGRRDILIMIYLISAIGAVAGGWLAGKLMTLGWTANKARKTTMLLCAFLTVPVFCAALTENRWLAAGLITLAACGHQAWGANALCLPGDMFPKSTVASLVGIAGVCSTGFSMILMYAIGQIVKTTGSYFPIFIMASAAYLLALACTHLLAPALTPVSFEVPQSGWTRGEACTWAS